LRDSQTGANFAEFVTIAGTTEQFKSTALNADMLRKMTLKEFGLSDEGDPL
jgi:hypothetical protein